MHKPLTQEQLQFLNDSGYLVIKRHIPYEQLQAAREAADRVVKKCLDTNYPYCRSDNRLSDTFIEKIDNIFSPNLFEPELLNPLLAVPIIDYAKQALNSDDLYLAFNRLHVTRKYSAWSAWHRDAQTQHELYCLKITMPFFNETGFYVIPGSHKRGNTRLDGGLGESEICAHQPDEKRIPVHAGDILIFHSTILHRGTCPGREKYRRAHLHFNFIDMRGKELYGQVKQDFLAQDYLMSRVPEDWKEIFRKDVPQHYMLTQQHPQTTFLGRIKQLLARGFYYSSSLLPHRWVQSPPRWLVPYIRPLPLEE